MTSPGSAAEPHRTEVPRWGAARVFEPRLRARRRRLFHDVHLVPALRYTVLPDPQDAAVEVHVLDGLPNALSRVVHGPSVPVSLLVAGAPHAQLLESLADAPESGRRPGPSPPCSHTIERRPAPGRWAKEPYCRPGPSPCHPRRFPPTPLPFGSFAPSVVNLGLKSRSRRQSPPPPRSALPPPAAVLVFLVCPLRAPAPWPLVPAAVRSCALVQECHLRLQQT